MSLASLAVIGDARACRLATGGAISGNGLGNGPGVGDFTTSLPGMDTDLEWNAAGSVTVEGSRQLRDINRMLGLDFPLDGPKTLNGLILEHFQDIPEAGVSVKLAGVPVEVLQTKDRSVVTARIFRP